MIMQKSFKLRKKTHTDKYFTSYQYASLPDIF